jgi:ankyrin repeat protein
LAAVAAIEASAQGVRVAYRDDELGLYSRRLIDKFRARLSEWESRENDEDGYGSSCFHRVIGKLQQVTGERNGGMTRADSDRGDAEAGDRLIAAISAGDRPAVGSMLDRGVSAHQADSFGQKPMFVAARDGKPDIIELLIDRGVDPNAPVHMSRGPLYFAASNGQPEAVRTLLARGANVNAIDEYGQTPLLTAATQLATEKLNVRDPKAWRERQQRSLQGLAAVVEELLRAGADPDFSRDRQHYTSRHFLRSVDIPRLTALMGEPRSSGSLWGKLFGRR